MDNSCVEFDQVNKTMRYWISILLIICLGLCPIFCYKLRKFLFNEFEDKSKSLENIDIWRNKLKNDFKHGLKNLPQNIKKSFIAKADEVLKTEWRPLLATEFLEFKINGIRVNYESKNFQRRKRLEALVLAELITEKGQYINEIANGIWLLMEESSWTWPAHFGVQKAGFDLPDPNQFVIDLGAGETSANVAWLKFLLDDKLSKMSPMFVKRIDYELNRRIIQRYIHDDYKNWMGLQGQKVSNWNIWINTNILMTSLLAVNQRERIEMINKLVKSSDDWLNWYGDDGGVEEGTSYWYETGGRFIQFLYYMSSASNHQMDWSKNVLINNIGSYIYKMHIDDDYFVNFGDASAQQIPDPTLVFRYGELFNNSKMIEFAAYLYHLSGNESYLVKHGYSGHLHEFYLQMSSYAKLKDAVPKAPQPIESWLPDIQVVTLRTQEGSAKRLFLGAKGGNNGEFHNHNDVGNFVVYVDGKPAIIDIGVGVYTSKTFGPHRYDIWTMQSQWHNTPTINGVQQHNGKNYSAKNVSYVKEVNGGAFTADIAHAYPKEAHVDSWVRKLTFNRALNSIDLSETYKLNKFLEPIKIHFITVLNVTFEPNKEKVVLSDKTTKLLMNLKTEIFDIKLDEHKTEDKKLSQFWGQSVNRVTLIGKNKELNGKHSIYFTQK